MGALELRRLAGGMGNRQPTVSHLLWVRRCQLQWLNRVGAMMLFIIFGMPIGVTGAGERAKPFLIGALTDSWGPTPTMVGLRHGLGELGYRENEHFVIGVRFTSGDAAALPTAARELAQLGVDFIFATEPSAAKAAQMATSRIPIVFAAVGDPLGLGLIQSFARPGGNLTGVTELTLDLGPKRLEVFHEIISGLKRVLFPYNASDPYAVSEARVYRDAASRLGIVLVEQGGLASYGADFYASGWQAARLVDKILKGADPSEIPVEVNPKIELAINLQVAKTLGLTIAPEVLYRADRLVR
jgi:putative ABC transport system substrate-binding protein